MTEQGTDGGRHRVRLDRHGQLAGTLLGFAVGMTVNLFTDDFGYPGLTAGLTAAAVLATASYVRRLPPQATLARYATQLLLLAALPALLLAAAAPASWQPWAVAAAAALTITAVLIPTDPQKAVSLMFGVALIGGGVAVAGLGAALLTSNNILSGVALIGLGVAVAGFGAAVLTSRITLSGVAGIGIGVADAGLGAAALLTSNNILSGIALIGAGAATVVCSVVLLNLGGAGARVRTWWDRVTSDPAQLPGTTGPELGESAGPVRDSTTAAEPGRPGQGRPPA
jgi:hypothetical protein